MWTPRGWAGASNARAIVNARAACLECSRRRVERGEVELYLAPSSVDAVVESATDAHLARPHLPPAARRVGVAH